MIVRVKGQGRNDRVILKVRKEIGLRAGTGGEPPLRDLLKDDIVVTLMKKDKVSIRELLRLIWSIRRNISKKYLSLSLRRNGF